MLSRIGVVVEQSHITRVTTAEYTFFTERCVGGIAGMLRQADIQPDRQAKNKETPSNATGDVTHMSRRAILYCRAENCRCKSFGQVL